MPTTDNAYYSFLPWLRQGLAKNIDNEDTIVGGASGSTPTNRPSLDVSFKLKGDPVDGSPTAELGTYNQAVNLYGPGDIAGISRDNIVRTGPKNWVTNFEYNYLPFIEFYEEDFPWRYTPAKAFGNKLTPWLALVVLKEDEFERTTPTGGKLPSFKTLKAESTLFPPQDQMWAWAHAHVNKDLGSDLGDAKTEVDSLLANESHRAVSRLLSPRKLEPNTGYYAFLIPTFELGRLAGLELPIPTTNTPDALTQSWNTANTTDPTTEEEKIEFPIYYEWFFKTSQNAGFASMVQDLKAKSLTSYHLGFREMDIQFPGDSGFIGLASESTVQLGGVLRPLNFDPTADVSWDITDTNDQYISKLKDDINAPSGWQENPVTGNPLVYHDPVITPPMYGRWHAEKKELTNDEDWLNRANLDPRFRVFAGAGARVVKDNQESFMAQCWDQIEDVEAANRRLRMLKFAQKAVDTVKERTFDVQNDDNVISMTANLLANIKPSSVTIKKEIKDSPIPNYAATATFRKTIRTNGPFAISLSNTTTAFDPTTVLSNLNSSTIQVAPAYTAPTGISAFSANTNSIMTSAFVSAQPARNNFYLTNPGPSFYSPGTGTNSTLVAYNFSTASVIAAPVLTTAYAAPASATPITMATAATSIKNAIAPSVTLLKVADSLMTVKDVAGNIIPMATIDEIMASPKIEAFLADYLYDQSPDLLIPDMQNIPLNSVSLLGVDQRYIEAFMLGANYEMMSELLWRGYPTDQRGTVFTKFWKSFVPQSESQTEYDKSRVIKDIHNWTDAGNTPTGLSLLGNNAPSVAANPNNLLILTVRGELLRRYPKTKVVARKAAWKETGGGQYDPNNQAQTPDYYEERIFDGNTTDVEPIYFTMIDDVAFFGFEIDKYEAKGVLRDPQKPGWYFVFKEIPGDVNFGLLVGASSKPQNDQYSNWNLADWIIEDSSFLNMTTTSVSSTKTEELAINWGSDSADMAYITYRAPRIVAYHGSKLLENI